MKTASEKPVVTIFANVRFYYLVQRGTCAIFTLASTRRRRLSGKQGFNRNNFNTRWPRCGHGIRTIRTRHRAGVFNEPFAVSPIETANGSHD